MSVSKAAPALRLQPDRPDRAPRFGFKTIAEVLAGLLAEPHQSALVLGLHGAWGSGKSTLMDALEAALRKNDPDAIFIPFNAWKYQNREVLWRALILRVLDTLRLELRRWPEPERKQKESEIAELERSLYASFAVSETGALRVNWTGLATETILTVMRVAGGGLVGGLIGQAGAALRTFFDSKDKGGGEKDVAESIQRAAGILHREVVERNVEQVKAIDQFLERYQDLTEALGKDNRRIYVLIDDLDRCLPDEALTIFEAIKLFLDSPQCRYVVAIDRGMIRRGLSLRYKEAPEAVDPDEYIEKTISLSFDLPQLQVDQARVLLEASGLRTITEGADPWHDAIIAALGTNPRRIKRVANTLRVMRALATHGGKTLSEAESSLLLKMGLIAYRNSAVFDQIRRDPKLATEMQNLANRSRNITVSAAEMSAKLPEHLKVLADDNGFWALLRMPPDLSEAEFRRGAAWFRVADD
jgi:predicted KAP-like P-loop ATPase